MNKKLIAIAIAGAMSAPFAANAGEATIYGVMDVSIDAFDNDNAAAAEDSSTGVSSNSSRIGFKGSEDLGSGMKAVWQIESNVHVGNSDAVDDFGGRNTFAGLAGGFGTVILGKHDTPYKSVGRKADLFGNAVGDSRNLINNGHDLRPNNVIAYISPNMGGFSVVGAYVTDASDQMGWGNTQQEDGEFDAVSVSLNYSAGPLYVGLAHQSLGASEDPMAPAAAEDPEATRLAASYKMGAAKVTGLWQSEDNAGAVDGADRDVWGLGGAYTMGNNTVKLQYYNRDELDNTNDTDSSMWALGLDHAMSKQTKLYAVYADMDNGDNAAAALGGGGHGDSGPNVVVNGSDPSAFSVGMVHKF